MCVVLAHPLTAHATAPALPALPAACGAALLVGDPLDAGDDVHLGPADDHFRPGVPGPSAQTFVFGDEGDDCVLGSVGYDRLDGGAGGDRLVGGDGPDQLFGGAGDDTLLTGRDDARSAVSGGESVDAGPGDDTVAPGPGSTAVTLGAGDDRVLATDGSAGPIACGAGEDTVVADAGDTLTGCEHVTRAEAPTVRIRHAGGGVTLGFRSPWSRRGADGLIGWSATLTHPRGRGCGGLGESVTTRGRDVIVRLRPGPEAPPCRGRWSARVVATFEDDPQSECDGGGCGIEAAPVTATVPFTL